MDENLKSVAAFYPWQKQLWEKLYSSHLDNNQFAHALLLAGVAGTGKKALGFYLAKSLLCPSPQVNFKTGLKEACQLESCRSCQLFSSGNHPDFNHITLPEDKKIIPVDSIRELIQWSVLSSQFGGRKVIIIEPAEAMNPNAANSLLKTLEEPVDNTHIILLTNKKQALLPTIRSRCQTIDIALPAQNEALHWLQLMMEISPGNQQETNPQLLLSLVSGAPLRALEMAQGTKLDVRNRVVNDLLAIINDAADPVKIAELLFKQAKIKAKGTKPKLLINAYDVIYWLDSMVSDIVRLTHNCSPDTITNIDLLDGLQHLADELHLKNLLQLSDLLNKAYYEIQGSININLLYEKLLIDWKNCKQ